MRNERLHEGNRFSAPVPAGTPSGAPVLLYGGGAGLGAIPAVTATKDGEGGNIAGRATVWTEGVFDLGTTDAVAAEGTKLYITNAGSLTTTVGTNAVRLHTARRGRGRRHQGRRRRHGPRPSREGVTPVSIIDGLRARIEPPAAVQHPRLAGPGAPWGRGVLNALERLADAEGRRDTAERTLQDRTADLRAADGGAGDQVLDDPEAAASIGARIDGLRTQIRLQESALRVADSRLETARRALLREQADDLRARAARVDELAADSAAETERLLGLLLEHEGVRYAVPELINQNGALTGAFAVTATQRLELAARELRRLAWLAARVADGGVLPRWWSYREQIVTWPATVYGPHRLFSEQRTEQYVTDVPAGLQ